MYDEHKFAQRLTRLRMQKGVSARDMSLSLGQSESYINKIENGISLPSMMVFFYICEYFRMTPEQFFRYEDEDPCLSERFLRAAEKLSPRQTEHLLALIEDILT